MSEINYFKNFKCIMEHISSCVYNSWYVVSINICKYRVNYFFKKIYASGILFCSSHGIENNGENIF
jgi:hypothetical protein